MDADDDEEEEEQASSAVGLMSLWKPCRSAPGQPRLAPEVPLVSTKLTERWKARLGVAHWVESLNRGVRGLCDWCPQRLEEREPLSIV